MAGYYNAGQRLEGYMTSGRKFVYEIGMSGYSEDQISERIRIIRDVITDEKDIVIEIGQDYFYPVVRIRCTWETFQELRFRLDLQMIRLWV